MKNRFLKYFILTLLIACFHCLEAQNSRVLDSLLKALNGNLNDTLRITTLQKIGLQYEKTDPDKAIEYTLQSKELAQKLNDKGLEANAWLNLSEQFRLKDDYLTAKNYVLKAILLYRGEKDSLHVAYAYNNLGLICEDLSENDKALTYYKESLRIKKLKKDSSSISGALTNIGVFYSQQGDFKNAEVYFNEALDFNIKSNDSIGISKSYNNLGILHKNKGDYQKAVACYLKSLEIKERMGNVVAIATSYENIGGVYSEMKNYAKTFDYYYKALSLAHRHPTPSGKASIYNRLGLVHQKTGNPDSAEYYLRKSYQIYSEINHRRGLSNASNNLGIVLKDRGKFREALLYLERSKEIDGQLNNPLGTASTLINIGMVRHELKNYGEAVSAVEDALKIYQGHSYIVGQMEGSKILSDMYHLQKNYERSLFYHKEFVRYKDSLMKEDNIKGLNELEAKYNSEKKEREIMKLSHEKELGEIERKLQKEASEKRTVYFAGGMASVVLISLVLLFAFIQKRKSNTLLTQQNIQIEHQKKIVEEKQKEILDSIRYARRIQKAHLPNEKVIAKNLERLKRG